MHTLVVIQLKSGMVDPANALRLVKDCAVTERPNNIAPKDAPPLKDLDDLYRYDPELVPVLLNGANLEHGRLGDAVDGAILDAASRLDSVAIGRARKGIAGLLGIPLGSLDDKLGEIVRKRVETGEGPGGDGLPGKPLTFDEIEPWHEQLNGAELLTELSGAIGTYVIMDAHQRDATALWTMFAHAHDFRDFAPLLIAKSAVKRSASRGWPRSWNAWPAYEIQIGAVPAAMRMEVVGNDKDVAGLGDEQPAEAWVARDLLQIRTGAAGPARCSAGRSDSARESGR